jgi:hypothetical protein
MLEHRHAVTLYESVITLLEVLVFSVYITHRYAVTKDRCHDCRCTNLCNGSGVVSLHGDAGFMQYGTWEEVANSTGKINYGLSTTVCLYCSADVINLIIYTIIGLCFVCVLYFSLNFSVPCIVQTCSTSCLLGSVRGPYVSTYQFSQKCLYCTAVVAVDQKEHALKEESSQQN